MGRLKRGCALGSCMQHTLHWLAAFLLLAFGAQGYAFGGDGASHTKITGPGATTQCPSADFQAFLGTFTESVHIQKAFTHFPVEKLIVVDADPEPKPVVKLLSRSQVSFPVISNSAERKEKGLAIRIDQVGKKKAQITLRKEDADYQVFYLFSKDSCWKLTRIEDWSL